MSNSDRYSRQTLVQQFGPASIALLANAQVLVVGAGGLGCQVAAQLAGAGVGQISLLDHDLIEHSNLHRQILFREADVGQAKALIAARELSAINSSISISPRHERINLSNARSLISGVSAVIDAADNFATSYLLSDYCRDLNVPMISASVNRTFGYLGLFCANQSSALPSYRAAFPRLPNDLQSCNLVGVTGPSVGVIASLQAQETLKLLLNGEHQLGGQLLYLDLWNYKQHRVDFNNAKEPANAVALIRSAEINDRDYVVDVRNPQEVADSPQGFQVNMQIPLNEISTRVDQIPVNGRLVFACQSGQRALMAAQRLSNEYEVCAAVVIPD